MQLLRLATLYRDTKLIYDELQGIKWKGKWEKFEREHEGDLRTFHMDRRKLDKYCSLAGKIPVHAWEQVKRNAGAAIRQQEQTRQKLREVERCATFPD